MFPRLQGVNRAPPTECHNTSTVVTGATTVHHSTRPNIQYQPLMNQAGYQNAGSAAFNSQNEPMCMVQQIQQTNTVLLSRLSSIESNVSRLGKIEHDVSSVRSEISILKLENISLNSKFTELETSCKFISDSYDKYAASEKKLKDTV